MKELIKPIYGWEDLYGASNFGRIWSYRSNRFIKTRKDKSGYQRVFLYKTTKIKGTFFVHRLVFETFNRPLKDNQHCHHIDKNRSNNIVTNLEAIDEAQHYSKHFKGRVFSQQHRRKLREAWKRRKSREKIN